MAAPARKQQPAPPSPGNAEENERRGAEILREKKARVAELERNYSELLADVVEGKAPAEATTEKGAALDAARRELESARKAHEVLVGRLAATRREQERASKVEARKLIERLCDGQFGLARQYEAIEKRRGEIWAALHQGAAGLAAAIVAARPNVPVPAGCLLDKTSLRVDWESEAYRQNANPDRLGGMGLMRPDGPPTIPGARAGDLRHVWQPEKLPSFAERMAQANAFLLATLDGASVAAADMPAVNGASAPATDSAPRSEFDRKRGELLRRQAQLAEDPSADEREYQAVIAALAELDAVSKTEIPNG